MPRKKRNKPVQQDFGFKIPPKTKFSIVVGEELLGSVGAGYRYCVPGSLTARHKNLNRKVSLLFDVRTSINQIAALSFPRKFLGERFWVYPFGKFNIASSFLGATNIRVDLHKELGGRSIAFVGKNDVRCFSPSRIHDSCKRMERILGCGMCEHGIRGDCSAALIKEYLQNEGFSEEQFVPCQSAPNWSWDDAVVACRGAVALEFIEPRLLENRLFSSSMKTIRDIDTPFSDTHKVKARFSERSREAAKTRAKRRICEKECVLNLGCFASNRRCGYHARHCQKVDPDDADATHGPYTEEKVDSIFERFLRQTRALPVDKISLIASNARCTTRLLGKKFVLLRMDKNMRDVLFLGGSPPGGDICQCSFDDAVKLLSLPYHYRGEYIYTSFSEPHRSMDKNELQMYTELCQNTCLRSYNVLMPRCGYGQYTPQLRAVVWLPGSRVIEVHSTGSYVQRITELWQVMIHTGRDARLPKLSVESK